MDLQDQLKDFKGYSSHGIRVLKHGKSYQYYIRTDKRDTSGKYLPKEKINTAKKIIQKEYLEKMVKSVRDELRVIDTYLKRNNPIILTTNYESLHEGRKILINPVEVGDDEFVNKWISVQYKGKNISEDSYEFYTNRGERVRSKSELIIANMLNKYNIPYRYEYPVKIKGMGIVYPDFATLNVRKRKEIYWEHLGLIDNEEYRTMVMRKLDAYEKTDIVLGDNLIVTAESSKQPLSTVELEQKIRTYLM
ncbi:MAG: hypothetical protein MJ107_06300 [Lachnospiraceae bacterium]|nr:hypothetical protein [Lachnospiraceae bacterium]